ncbi:MAG TPA: redoxin domain-containing protein [bacterium]|nr:redoxin domain-containing protein [bacterium]
MRTLVLVWALAAAVAGAPAVNMLSGLLSPVARAQAATAAPELSGGGPWFNTDGRPLTIASLRGKVVGVEMWTAGCENCLNVLPHLKEWYARYGGRGLVLVGVHTPEFAHEGKIDYVREAVARLGIAYPVVMDNDRRIWNAYHNDYWPTLYLVDKRGQLRYTHIGEGDYDVTEREIGRLLGEKI